jgi:hypothetical protein
MRKILCAGALTGMLASCALAGSAAAQSATYEFVCQTSSGTQTFELTKSNDNSAAFTNGKTLVVSAIGASIGSGSAQPNATACTVNGNGPFLFLIVRS